MKESILVKTSDLHTTFDTKQWIGMAAVAVDILILFVAHQILGWSASNLTLLILGLVSILFIFELVPIAIAALGVPVALWYTGVLSADSIFSGFSDSTVIIFGGMFVVGGAMFSTGIVDIIGEKMAKVAGKSESAAMLGVMIMSAGLSSMLSNTGTVAVLLPICVGFSKSVGCSRTRLLMPLAFSCSLGGLISLVGTPPNTLVMKPGGYRFNDYVKAGLPLLFLCYLTTLVIVPIFWPLYS